jgi:HNH endonuclease
MGYMSEPSPKTIKRLFALSLNKCAFSGCSLPIEFDKTITGEVCHIFGNKPKSARYNPNLAEHELHAFDNLILLCRHHHKIIDDQPDTYTISKLQEMKRQHEARSRGVETTPRDAVVAELLLDSYRNVYIETNQGNIVIENAESVNTSSIFVNKKIEKVNINPPSGSIASSLPHANYVKHLIDRYNEFSKQDESKKPFRYMIIYESIKRKFGSKWDRIPIERFLDVVDYLHKRIDRTKIGSVRKGKGYILYSSFDDYCDKYMKK